jgi:hypothetical protein
MTTSASSSSGLPGSLSHVVISLMKGVVYQEEAPGLWQALLNLQGHVRDHVSVLGLQLVLDEAEGHAYLRQRPTAEGEPALPRLVPRRQLSYGVSLLLALLRKRLVELDAAGGSSRLVLRREDIHELVRLFLPDATNEARRVDRLDADIAKVVDLGFLRELRESEDTFEVRRILKAFVDAQWLDTLEQRLAGYRAHLAEEGEGSE